MYTVALKYVESKLYLCEQSVLLRYNLHLSKTSIYSLSETKFYIISFGLNENLSICYVNTLCHHYTVESG